MEHPTVVLNVKDYGKITLELMPEQASHYGKQLSLACQRGLLQRTDISQSHQWIYDTGRLPHRKWNRRTRLVYYWRI